MKSKLIICVIIVYTSVICGIVKHAKAAAIEHGSLVTTTLQTHTGNTDWTTKITVSNSNFTPGDKYFIMCTASYGGSNNNSRFGVRLLHGSIVFIGAESTQEPAGFGTTDLHEYFYMTVWTAVADQDIIFQLRTFNSSYTATADSIVISWMNLSDGVYENVDWVFNEDATSRDLTTTWTDAIGATISFTPLNADDNWLIIGNGCFNVNALNYNMQMRISRDDEADTEPIISQEGEDTDDTTLFGVARAYTLSNEPHKFEIQCSVDSGSSTGGHISSRIFALRLNAFNTHKFVWNEAEISLTNQNTWYEMGTLTYQPDATGNALILGVASIDGGDAGKEVGSRIQIDGITNPGGSDAHQTLCFDGTDEFLITRHTIESFMGASSYTIDWDARETNDVNPPPQAEDRFLVVFSMELAPVMHYVSSSGGDAYPYTSWETAAHYIQDAINAAVAGENVIVAGGTYSENITMHDGVDVVNNPGNAPAIVGNGTTAAVKFDNEFTHGCRLDGFDISGSGNYPGIYVHGTGSAGITNTTVVTRCIIHGNSGPGIQINGSTAITAPIIDNNTIYSNGGGGIHVIDAGSSTVDSLIKNNSIFGHDITTKAGIHIEGASYVTIGTDNLIYENFAGIGFDTSPYNPSSRIVTIRGNEIYENNEAGIYVRDSLTGSVDIIDINKIYRNDKCGIGIQNSCTLLVSRNDIYDNLRGGMHTGTDSIDGGGFFGERGSAILTIQQNRVHNNGKDNYGGGIDVRHASGTIENNLVYGNHRGGIRFGGDPNFIDIISLIKNNTVVYNGDPNDVYGGGIIYDDLAGEVNEPPGGNPPGPLDIINNICAYNRRAGLRACFNNVGEERNYNLLYSNNGSEANPDCGWPDDLSGPPYQEPLSCIQMQYGGCGAEIQNGDIILYDPDDILADPMFQDTNNYQLQSNSPAKDGGYVGGEMGAWGGSKAIDWYP
ncbi:MAG: nitrous oxide reductase family maturation protein NosD [bacterium]